MKDININYRYVDPFWGFWRNCNFLKLVALLCALIYAWMVYVIYKNYIHPSWSYMGYDFFEPQSNYLFLTIVFAAIPSVFLSNQIGRPSEIVAWLLYLMAFVPSMVVPLISIKREYIALVPLQLCLLVGMIFISLINRIKITKFKNLGIGNNGFFVIMLMLSILLYALMIFGMGFRFSPPSWDEITEVRMAQRVAAASAGLSVYAVSWLSMVINPSLIIFGMIFKRKYILIIGLIGQLFMFAQGGQKSVLFIIPMLFGFDFIIKRAKHLFGIMVISLMCLIFVVCISIDNYLDVPILSSLLVRRAVVTPGLLTGFYFDYYSVNSFAYYSHSFFKFFIDNNYAISPPFLIGWQYFGDPDMSANANIWADAYANLGLFGIILHSTILGGVLWGIDCLASRVSPRAATLLIVAPAWAMVDSALFTSLLTHGVGILALIFWFASGSSIHDDG